MIQAKARDNRMGEANDTRMYSRSSSFLWEVRLRWSGVATRSPPMPQRLTLFSGEQATEASSLPLSVGLEEDDQNLYTELGAHIYN
jgi:hypothetical protein